MQDECSFSLVDIVSYAQLEYSIILSYTRLSNYNEQSFTLFLKTSEHSFRKVNIIFAKLTFSISLEKPQ